MGTSTKGGNDLNTTGLLSCLRSKKNEYDKQRSHLTNPMHCVYRFYSSVGSSPESSEGESDDNGPSIPSELSVNPL